MELYENDIDHRVIYKFDFPDSEEGMKKLFKLKDLNKPAEEQKEEGKEEEELVRADSAAPGENSDKHFLSLLKCIVKQCNLYNLSNYDLNDKYKHLLNLPLAMELSRETFDILLDLLEKFMDDHDSLALLLKIIQF